MFHGLIEKIREINEKYKNPKIKTTGLVKVWLLFLRFYLIFLVAVLIYKFILTVRGQG
jgi:hypothetical protein